MEELKCIRCSNTIEPVVGRCLYRLHLGEICMERHGVEFEEWDEPNYLCYSCAEQHYVTELVVDAECCAACGKAFHLDLMPDYCPEDEDEWLLRIEVVHIVESNKGPFPTIRVHEWGVVHRDCAITNLSLYL